MKFLTLSIVFLVINICFCQTSNLDVYDKNKPEILAKNKVKSISYFTVTKSTKLAKKDSIKLISKIEYIDRKGRNYETVYFDSSQKVNGKTKYYYLDSSYTEMFKKESFDSNDSLIKVIKAEMSENGMIYLMNSRGVKCFGHNEFEFAANNLISKINWYAPREGIFANDSMILSKVTYLSYDFYKD